MKYFTPLQYNIQGSSHKSLGEPTMNLPSSTSHYYVSIVPRSHWQKMSLMFLMSLRILQSWGGGTYQYVLHSGNNSKVDSSSAKLDLGDCSQTMKLLCCVLFKFQAEIKTLLTQVEQTDKNSVLDFVLSGFQYGIHREIEMGVKRIFLIFAVDYASCKGQ